MSWEKTVKVLVLELNLIQDSVDIGSSDEKLRLVGVMEGTSFVLNTKAPTVLFNIGVPCYERGKILNSSTGIITAADSI